MCCNRAFLTYSSFQNHKESGNCWRSTTHDDDSSELEESDESPIDSSDQGSSDDENQKVEPGMRLNVARRTGVSSTPNTIQRAAPPPPPYPERSGIFPGRKISLLERRRLEQEGVTSESDFGEEQEKPSSTSETIKRSSATPSPVVDVMSLVNLGTKDGKIVLTCKRCDFSTGETVIITEHIKV